MREIPHSPMDLYEVAHPFGTLIAETILASVHMRARKQAGHTGASDLIKVLQNTLRGGGRPHTANAGVNQPAAKLMVLVPYQSYNRLLGSQLDLRALIYKSNFKYNAAKITK